MATMTISLPDPLKEWIEAQIKQGDYASTGLRGHFYINTR